MTAKSLSIRLVLAMGVLACGCSTMGHKKVAETMATRPDTQAKAADKPKDQTPKGFVREIMDSGYISNTKSPSAYLYP